MICITFALLYFFLCDGYQAFKKTFRGKPAVAQENENESSNKKTVDGKINESAANDDDDGYVRGGNAMV